MPNSDTTWKDFYDFLMRSEKFMSHFPNHSKLYIQDYFQEIIDEIRFQISDWYEGNSYYPKPEDILVDYTFCTPEQAHKFLQLFLEERE